MIRALLLSAAAPLVAFIPVTTASSAPIAASAVDKFAVCATRNYDGAELLATQPGSAEETEVIAEYGRRSCAPPALDAGILRGAVAEQLFKADFGAIGARPRRETIEVFTIDANELAALSDAAKKRIDYVAFGTCVAASNPDQSSKLMGTTPESADEKAILTSLVPQFASCLTEGERFTFSRADLRSSLAEGAYRLALAQSLSEEVVVTGTRDPSKSVKCKLQDAPGSHMRKNVCLTEAQWKARDRDNEILAEDLTREAQKFNDINTAIITRTRFPGGS